MPKTMNVRVTTVDAELEFAIQTSTTGKQLFDQITKTVGIRETWYFGLSFVDSIGQAAWLNMEKKVSSQDVKKETPLKFRFRVRFYPEDVAEELIQDITRHMFYLQVRDVVINDDVYCPPETSVLLASYILQAKHGDYNPATQKKGFISVDKVIPARVIKQHSIAKDQWEERIITWYEEHKGMQREDAMMEFLKIAQDLEMYGVTYYEIRNKKGTELFLGVDALGINIYEKSDKLTPKIGFPWSEIRNVSFSNKKFIIKPIDKKAPDFVFYTSKMLVNKRILELCMGNHELYMRRRKQESIEVQQMKAQAKEERASRQAERLLLAKEKKEREEAERKRHELEEQLTRYSTQFENAKIELEKSQLLARSLEERMVEAERERRELEEAQRRAEEARHRAEEAANLEKAERELKEQEAAEAQAILALKLAEAHEREEEARRLQHELDEARAMMEENQRALEEARSAPPTIVTVTVPALAAAHVVNHHHDENDYENGIGLVKRDSISSRGSRCSENSSGHSGHSGRGGGFISEHIERSSGYSEHGDDVEGVARAALIASAVSMEDDRRSEDQEDRRSEPDTPEVQSHELQVFENGATMTHPEEDRIMEAEKNERINQQLKMLSAELEASKLQAAVTHNDVIYRQNVAAGRNKYQTLKQIRQGNTKHRVDIFEAM